MKKSVIALSIMTTALIKLWSVSLAFSESSTKKTDLLLLMKNFAQSNDYQNVTEACTESLSTITLTYIFNNNPSKFQEKKLR